MGGEDTDGLVFFESGSAKYADYPRLENLHISECYNCKKIAVWVHDRLLFPIVKQGVLPNPDLPDDVLHDYEEAREIVSASPRGAAALLRLCVQKLCRHLGEKGKNIDDDIAALVRSGLDPLVQQSLDIVRVIGNEAVHPGVFDLKDDRETALRLFELVNAITDQMGCWRRRRNVRLLSEAALALGFADVSHGAVEIGVRAVGRVSDHAVDDERSLRGERGDFLVAVSALV